MAYKKLKISDMEKFYTDVEPVHVDFNGVDLLISKYLTIKDKMEFVKTVFDLCVIDGVYFPELFDFAIKCATYGHYTNITVPDGLKKANNLAYSSDLYDVIVKNINKDEYEALINATKMQIKKYMNPDPMDKIADAIKDLCDSIAHDVGTVDFERLNKLLQIVAVVDDKKETMQKFKNVYIEESKVNE